MDGNFKTTKGYFLLFVFVSTITQFAYGEMITLSISEATPVGTIIYVLSPNCNDTLQPITYNMRAGQDFFSVNNQGRVQLRSPLDMETRSRQSCEVVGTNNETSFVWTFTILVMDWNDNRPMFTKSSYNATIPENSYISALLYLIATDADATTLNKQITYTVIEPPGQNNFMIMSGAVKPRFGKIFDYETQKQYTFGVIATDKGTPSLSSFALVNIYITNLNDNSPTFESSTYQFLMLSNALNNSVVGTVKAIDKDAGDTIRYSLSNALSAIPVGDTFNIDSNGNIRLLVSPPPLNIYNFSVTATDSSGKIGNSLVVIKVVVQNHKIVYYTLSEALPVQTVIHKGTGSLKQGQPLSNYVVNPPEMADTFGMNWRGDIYLKSQLDYEKNKTMLVGFAYDDNAVGLIINVEDANDKAPIVAVSPPYVRTTTNYPSGSVVAVVHAQDPDTVNIFTFKITSGDPTNIFSIDNNGVITTTRCLSNAAVSFLMITIDVNDGVHTVNKTVPFQIYKATDKDFDQNCGLDCNPVTFSLTSTADGNVTFSNIVKNGKELNVTELEEIVNNPDWTDYKEIVDGISNSLTKFFEERYTLMYLNVKRLSAVGNLRRRRTTQQTGYLNAEYVFNIKTTDATLKDLNPIQRNQTIQFTNTSTFQLQTNPNLSTVSDVDECTAKTDICDVNAFCMVFPNSIAYACQCKDGFTGDGYSCKKEEEKMDKMVVIGVAVGCGVALIILVAVVVVVCKKKLQYQSDLKKYSAIKNAQIKTIGLDDGSKHNEAYM